MAKDTKANQFRSLSREELAPIAEKYKNSTLAPKERDEMVIDDIEKAFGVRTSITTIREHFGNLGLIEIKRREKTVSGNVIYIKDRGATQQYHMTLSKDLIADIKELLSGIDCNQTASKAFEEIIAPVIREKLEEKRNGLFHIAEPPKEERILF